MRPAMRPGHENDDTITAIATPIGVGAIAVLRLSGPQARQVFQGLWISSAVSVENFETHRFYYGKLAFSRTENGHFSPDIHRIIDTVMAVYFAPPRTYTGEEMVEISCHGGAVVVQEILAACLAAGARLATPGEFTRRAFLNGKLDLAQAEAVADVIHASSETARMRATEQLAGRLSLWIRRHMTTLTELRAFVEATIDFPEEDIEMIAHAGIAERLDPLRAQLQQLSATYQSGRLLRDGVRLTLVGAPNVGKSSLMNQLLGEERSIVHERPGTTRDYVDAIWNLEGIAVQVTDTAGLRDGNDEVEQLGIQRSRDKMQTADWVLLVCDGSRPLQADEQRMLQELQPGRALVVVNKNDLSLVTSAQTIQALSPQLAVVSVSARSGDGVTDLQNSLVQAMQGSGPRDVEGIAISNLRHKQALDQAIVHLTQAAHDVRERRSAEFVAHHLTKATQALGEIVGDVSTDDLLAVIFSRFCIGK